MSAIARGVVATLLAAALASAPAGLAAGQASREVGLRWTDRAARVSFSVADLVSDPQVRRKLASGLPQTVVLRVWARADGSEDDLARTARVCRIVYDLWSERWRVEMRDQGTTTTRTLPDLDAVVDRCLVARDLPLGDARTWASRSGRRVRFSVLAELNPLSDRTVQRIKRWLAQPGGRGGLDGGDAFFGSFVALFVNRRVGDADRVIRFRSQEIEVP